MPAFARALTAARRLDDSFSTHELFRSSVKIASPNRFSNTGNIPRERAIVRKRRHDFSHSSECSPDTATGLQWTAMFQTFGGRKQLDGEQVFRKINYRPQLQRARHSHRHVIFFSA
jgi:hypothetical protein